jgi:hypothetical protein
MDLKPALKKLENEEQFLKWKEKNMHTYFSYALRIPQEADDGWHMGFYCKDKDKITTFVMKHEGIEVRQEEDIFKQDERQVGSIILDNVKLSFEDVLGKAIEFQQKNFPKDRSVKTIAILQSLPGLGDIWNMTFVTEAFNTLNMKISPSNGKVLDHKMSSIFSFRQK